MSSMTMDKDGVWHKAETPEDQISKLNRIIRKLVREKLDLENENNSLRAKLLSIKEACE